MSNTFLMLTSRRWISLVAIFALWWMNGSKHHNVDALSLSSSKTMTTSLSWKLPLVPKKATKSSTTSSQTRTTSMCPLTLMQKRNEITQADFDPVIVADFEMEEPVVQQQLTNAETKWIILGLIGTALTGFMIGTTITPPTAVLPNIFTATATTTAVASTKSILSSWKGWSVLSVLASTSKSRTGLDIWSVLQRSVIKSFDMVYGMFGKTLRKMLLMELWFQVWKHPNSPISSLENYIKKDILSNVDLKSMIPRWLRRGTNKLIKKGLERTLERAAFQFAETIYSYIQQKILSFLWPDNNHKDRSNPPKSSSTTSSS